MNNRIRKIIENEELTAAQFANAIGIQASAVSHLTSGRNKPSVDVLQKILDTFPNISPDWLVSNRGGMYRSASNQQPQTRTEPSLFDNFQEEQKEPSVVAESVENERNKPENEPPQTPPESPVAQHPDVIPEMSKPRAVKKVLVLYSDGTFEELVK